MALENLLSLYLQIFRLHFAKYDKNKLLMDTRLQILYAIHACHPQKTPKKPICEYLVRLSLSQTACSPYDAGTSSQIV